MIDATVMPHHLYRHSSEVQSRAVSNTVSGAGHHHFQAFLRPGRAWEETITTDAQRSGLPGVVNKKRTC
jgi:Mn2+/Fe2+ NRAMP family transporter